MRILLVEDEKTLSGYIAKGLQNSGYAVDAVYDGEEYTQVSNEVYVTARRLFMNMRSTAMI